MSEKSTPSVRLRNAGLTEVNGEVIAQGFLDLDSINQLRVGDYQREVLKTTGSSRNRRTGIEIAVSQGARLPTIVIGMRGQNFRSSGDDILLYDPLFIVDGLQRVSALKEHANKHPEDIKNLLIGAEVRFATNREVEKELFQTLNLRRTSMSPNVILRNLRDTHRAVLTLYGLSTNDSTSPLFERVQWTQRKNRGELLTALSVVQVADTLHRHITPIGLGKAPTGKGTGKTSGSGALTRVTTLDRRANTIGLKTFRENVVEFFDALDETWGFRKIEYSELATHLRGNFMQVLAQLFSDHDDFWSGDRLVVSALHKKRLALFRIDDPNIVKLAGGSNTTKPILYSLLRDHMNKGMKKNRLRARKEDASKEMDAAA